MSTSVSSTGLWRLLVCFCVLVPSECLQADGENVCVKQRLRKVLDVYPSDWENDWDCELSYPNTTCDDIRSGEVSIDSVYFLEESLTCCPGWTRSEGVSCTIPCEEGDFGEDCEYECRCFNSVPGCDPVDGSCRCLEGWTGPSCDQRCPPQMYGPNCLLQSDFNCENGGTSDPVTGMCLCPYGKAGLECEITCPPRSEFSCGELECDRCSTHSSSHCDSIAGACICEEGWRGRYCTELCRLGSGGRFCEDECCSSNGRCFMDLEDSDPMECFCEDGYHGDECQLSCPDGRFGRDCERECQCPSCDSVTGTCESCPSGFKGPQCLQRCSEVEWGPSCASRCSCSDEEPCDVFSGRCATSSNLTWLIVCSLLLIFMAIIIVVGCVYYRHRSKKDEGNHGIGQAQTENVYGNSTWGTNWEGSQHLPGSRNGVDNNGPAATPKASLGLGGIEHNQTRPPGTKTLANNPLYGAEKIESTLVRGEGRVGDGKNTSYHEYDDPFAHSDDPFDVAPPPQRLIHEYDYLRTDGAGEVHLEPEGTGLYHVPFQ